MSIYTQYPVSGIGECGAFYRIFFGQEYRIAIGKGKIGCGVGMVVGKCVRRKRDAQCFQMLKITLRMPDAGDSMIARFVKISCSGRQARVEQVIKYCSVKAHLILPRCDSAAVKLKLAQRFVCPLSRLRERGGERGTGLHVNHHRVPRLQAGGRRPPAAGRAPAHGQSRL